MKQLINRLMSFTASVRDMSLQFNLNEAKRLQKFNVAFFRMIMITLKCLKEDLLLLRASALTYITLVSIVPTMVVAFALAKGLGASDLLVEMINKSIVDFPDETIDFINELITTILSANYTAMGATGLIITFLTVNKLLGNIEHSFNEIWGVKQCRPWVRKMTDYVFTVVTIPILLILSYGITTFLTSERILTKVQEFFPIGGGTTFLISLIGIFAIIFAFFLLYIWMPNTKVNLLPALVGGIVAGLSWKIVIWTTTNTLIKASQGNPVYGSFALVPVGLAGLYLTWVVTLIGCEIAFALQHWKTYDLESDPQKNLSFNYQTSLALIITERISNYFQEGKPWNANKFSEYNAIPIKPILEVLDKLEKHDLIEFNQEPEPHYLPKCDLRNIDLRQIIASISGAECDIGLKESSQLNNVYQKEWDSHLNTLEAYSIGEHTTAFDRRIDLHS